VKSRIRRLLEISSDRAALAESNWLLRRMLPATALLALFALTAVAASNTQVLVRVHTLVEHAVSILS